MEIITLEKNIGDNMGVNIGDNFGANLGDNFRDNEEFCFRFICFFTMF